MIETRNLTVTRAADTPREADLRGLDGDPDAMFPLLTATEVARKLGFSAPWVHQMWDQGRMPYVLWEHGTGRGDPSTERRNRRMRSDHLREAVTGRTRDVA